MKVLIFAAAFTCAVAADADPSTPKLVWSGPEVTLLGGVSRDGRFLSYVDESRNIAVREIASGRSRSLTRRPEGSREFGYFSSISPDSRRVAYAWFNADGFYDLRVIDFDGSNERILYRNEEAGFVQPCAWTPDSESILTLLFRADNISQIALVPIESGPPKILRSLNWVYPKRMDLSPDGRYIVYDSFAGDTPTDRTIFLLSIDGSSERKLVNLPGNHLFPLWMPDGKRIVYASDRAGTMDAWQLEIENGEARGAPTLVRRDLGRLLPMNITSAGEFYFGLRTGLADVFVTKLGEPAAKAQRATLRFPGRNTAPSWSPDGKMLAYLSRRGSENFGQESRSIVIRRFGSDEEREIAPKLAHLERLRWSPDGKALLASGSDSKGRGGVFLVDPETGTARPLVTEAAASFRGFHAVWSKEGDAIFYIHPSGELRRKEIATGTETTLYREKLDHLAASPDGKLLAAVVGSKSIALIPVKGGDATTIAFEGLTELEWGRELIAGRGAELWRIPRNGEAPVKIDSPGNRNAGFSLHPDGERLALTAGNTKSEIWMLPLR